MTRWERKRVLSVVHKCTSIRSALKELGLTPAGGNYKTFHRYCKENQIDITHFKGHAWSRGLKITCRPGAPLNEILILGRNYQSYKLKKRLINEGIKEERCEECGWCERSSDGRIPVELDHINGNPRDNRLQNLRVLCPNCHSLKPNHRGKNIGSK
jgi:hypothetical protein